MTGSSGNPQIFVAEGARSPGPYGTVWARAKETSVPLPRMICGGGMTGLPYEGPTWIRSAFTGEIWQYTSASLAHAAVLFDAGYTPSNPASQCLRVSYTVEPSDAEAAWFDGLREMDAVRVGNTVQLSGRGWNCYEGWTRCAMSGPAYDEATQTGLSPSGLLRMTEPGAVTLSIAANPPGESDVDPHVKLVMPGEGAEFPAGMPLPQIGLAGESGEPPVAYPIHSTTGVEMIWLTKDGVRKRLSEWETVWAKGTAEEQIGTYEVTYELQVGSYYWVYGWRFSIVPSDRWPLSSGNERSFSLKACGRYVSESVGETRVLYFYQPQLVAAPAANITVGEEVTFAATAVGLPVGSYEVYWEVDGEIVLRSANMNEEVEVVRDNPFTFRFYTPGPHNVAAHIVYKGRHLDLAATSITVAPAVSYAIGAGSASPEDTLYYYVEAGKWNDDGEVRISSIKPTGDLSTRGRSQAGLHRIGRRLR